MRVRYLLPAMGALAITPAFAADGVGFQLNGWSDNILTISQANQPDSSVTPDPGGTVIGFNSAATLKVGWNVGSDVAGNITLVTDDVGAGATLNVRQVYASWMVNKETTLTMGKTYRSIGWIANEAPSLYTINASLIGYDAMAYGVDPIGLQVAFTPAGQPVSGSIAIYNGLFDATDAKNKLPAAYTGGVAPASAQEHSDLGLLAELKYVAEGQGKLNLELAYDMSGGDTSTAKGGNVFQIGLNGEYTGTQDIVLAAEAIYRMTGDGEDAAGSSVSDTGSTGYALMGLANFVLPKIGGTVPAAATVQVQYWSTEGEYSGAKAATALGAQAALMTNPTATSNFGWNFELGITSFKDEDGFVTGTPSTETVRDIVASTEMIVVF